MIAQFSSRSWKNGVWSFSSARSAVLSIAFRFKTRLVEQVLANAARLRTQLCCRYSFFENA